MSDAGTHFGNEEKRLSIDDMVGDQRSVHRQHFISALAAQFKGSRFKGVLVVDRAVVRA